MTDSESVRDRSTVSDLGASAPSEREASIASDRGGHQLPQFKGHLLSPTRGQSPLNKGPPQLYYVHLGEGWYPSTVMQYCCFERVQLGIGHAGGLPCHT